MSLIGLTYQQGLSKPKRPPLKSPKKCVHNAGQEEISRHRKFKSPKE
jgi:hypothetical protein